MTYTMIPAGYRLTIDTWENDLDYRRTEVLEGLNHDDILFYTDLCKLFMDGSNKGRLGNIYEPNDEEINRVFTAANAVLRKYGKISEDEDEASEVSSDYLYKIGVMNGDFFTRVVQSFKVEHVKMDIFLEDMTYKFLKDYTNE